MEREYMVRVDFLDGTIGQYGPFSHKWFAEQAAANGAGNPKVAALTIEETTVVSQVRNAA